MLTATPTPHQVLDMSDAKQAATCSLPVPALCGRDGRAPSHALAMCQVVRYKAWDPAWVHSILSVVRAVSILSQAHRYIPSREAAPWYPAPGYLNRGLHPVTTVACYSCGPPGAINRQLLLLQEAALSQGVDIFMPSHPLGSSYCLQESEVCGYLEIHTCVFPQPHSGKERMLGDAHLA